MARYTVHTVDGVKQKAVYGKTRVEASQKLNKAMAALDSGFGFDAGKVTVGEYLARWLEDSVRGSVKPVTFESYERLLRVHAIPGL